MDILFDRVSCRNYKNDDISQEDLEYILNAGMSAPTAYNAKEWSFLVVKNKETHKQIMKVHAGALMLENAPVAILVLADIEKQYKNYWQQDCAAATQNILLAATAKGYGSVWCGVATNIERQEAIAKIFNLPHNIIPFSLVVIGKPNEDKKVKQRWDPAKVKYENYNS